MKINLRYGQADIKITVEQSTTWPQFKEIVLEAIFPPPTFELKGGAYRGEEHKVEDIDIYLNYKRVDLFSSTKSSLFKKLQALGIKDGTELVVVYRRLVENVPVVFQGSWGEMTVGCPNQCEPFSLSTFKQIAGQPCKSIWYCNGEESNLKLEASEKDDLETFLLDSKAWFQIEIDSVPQIDKSLNLNVNVISLKINNPELQDTQDTHKPALSSNNDRQPLIRPSAPQPLPLWPSLLGGALAGGIIGGASFGIMYGTTAISSAALSVEVSAAISISASVLLGLAAVGLYHLSLSKEA